MPRITYTPFALNRDGWTAVRNALELYYMEAPCYKLRRPVALFLTSLDSAMSGLFVRDNPNADVCIARNGDAYGEAADDHIDQTIGNRLYSLPLPPGFAPLIRIVAEAEGATICEGMRADSLPVDKAELYRAAETLDAKTAPIDRAKRHAAGDALESLSLGYFDAQRRANALRRVADNASPDATNDGRKGDAFKMTIQYEFVPSLDSTIDMLADRWASFPPSYASLESFAELRALWAKLPRAAIGFVAAEWLASPEGGKYSTETLAAIRPLIVEFYIEGGFWIRPRKGHVAAARVLIVAALREFARQARERSEGWAEQARAEAETAGAAVPPASA